jgi:hypothetical protein
MFDGLNIDEIQILCHGILDRELTSSELNDAIIRGKSLGILSVNNNLVYKHYDYKYSLCSHKEKCYYGEDCYFIHTPEEEKNSIHIEHLIGDTSDVAIKDVILSIVIKCINKKQSIKRSRNELSTETPNNSPKKNKLENKDLCNLDQRIKMLESVIESLPSK